MIKNDKNNVPGVAPHEMHGELSEAFVLLDNSSGTKAPSLLFTEPRKIVRADRPEDVEGAISQLEEAVASGLHAAGYFSYELGYVMEPRLRRLMPEKRVIPLLWFGLYEAPRQMTGAGVLEWLNETTRSAAHEFSDVSLAWTQAEYEERFNKSLEMIRSGDIYQINLTFKSRFKLSGSPLTFYRDLRAKQPVAYGAIVDTGEATVLSASPELFIEQEGRQIHTRPMKGTAARLGAVEADEKQRCELASDHKQRAENLMIVDLMRNDLGRIAEIGSVRVDDLFTIETFKTLHQMTSGVTATLREGVGLRELLAGIFPPGSITGAPKIRAMELIAELETEARGVYCGAIGHISPEGRSHFNVAIRTPVIMRGGEGEMGIGSGVVYDSKGGSEYEECLLKMKFLTDPPMPFEIIETMLYEPAKGIWLFERHMDRLQSSADHFAFECDLRRVRAAIDEVLEGRRDEVLRVRLTLSENGTPNVTATELGEGSTPEVMRFVVSPSRLNSADRFLYHKTTRRELYDSEWKTYNEDFGADEVVYLNELGELAEGSRTSIFIERDGVLVTPRLSAGLLPGTLRAELLASGRAVEGRLALVDLMSAEVCYLGNSVRGLVRAEALEVPDGPEVSKAAGEAANS
ncbi:MAG: aminodeoxychorismate synthase component I [Alphaproteobacteria bacterium]|nr:aminodeoxychorismate synthase component I [Alphaproteobacteria bacterium]